MKRLIFFIVFVLAVKIIYTQPFNLMITQLKNLQKGKRYDIEINLEKGDFTGFAEIFISFPSQIQIDTVISEGYIKRSSNTAKIYWANLPLKSQIKVKIGLKVNNLPPKGFVVNYGIEYQADNQRGIIVKHLRYRIEGQKAILSKEEQEIEPQKTVNAEIKEVYDFFKQ